MSDRCGSNECSTGETDVKTLSGTEVKCPCCYQTPCSDPYECGMAMWSCSFIQAMKEVQVDILKEKIRKSWGDMMGQAADGVIQSMSACWQSAIAKAKEKEEFKELLKKLWQQGK